MGRIITACMARNEADRFWRSALEAWADFSDEIIVLDDWSEDDTHTIAEEEYGATVYTGAGTDGAWGKESPARQQLWGLSVRDASVGDIILILDADMIPARDPRPIFEMSKADAFAFPLYDLWGRDADGRLLYRDDAYWRGHTFPRFWAIRVKEGFHDREWKWSERGIHSGHLPQNYSPERHAFVPRDHSLLHYAYLTPELRRKKHAQYMSVADQLSSDEAAHAASIIDEEPNLRRLPFEPEYELELVR